MSKIRSALSQLRRPRLLIRAVRLGAVDYRRERDLRRLIGRTLPPEQAALELLETESRLERNRLHGEATYSVAQHIEVLIALVAEVKLSGKDDAEA